MWVEAATLPEYRNYHEVLLTEMIRHAFWFNYRQLGKWGKDPVRVPDDRSFTILGRVTAFEESQLMTAYNLACSLQAYAGVVDLPEDVYWAMEQELAWYLLQKRVLIWGNIFNIDPDTGLPKSQPQSLEQLRSPAPFQPR